MGECREVCDIVCCTELSKVYGEDLSSGRSPGRERWRTLAFCCWSAMSSFRFMFNVRAFLSFFCCALLSL